MSRKLGTYQNTCRFFVSMKLWGLDLLNCPIVLLLLGMWEEWAVEDFAHHQNAQSEAILELTLVCHIALVRMAVIEFFKQSVVLFAQLTLEIGHGFGNMCGSLSESVGLWHDVLTCVNLTIKQRF